MPEAGSGRPIVIKGGRIIDSTSERSGDVLVVDGRIAEVGPDLNAEVVLDAGGAIVSPGLVDLHTHLRQPGQRGGRDHRNRGQRGGARGLHRCARHAQHDTRRSTEASVVREVLELGRAAVVDVHTSGAITVGRAGEQLAPMAEMAALGRERCSPTTETGSRTTG